MNFNQPFSPFCRPFFGKKKRRRAGRQSLRTARFKPAHFLVFALCALAAAASATAQTSENTSTSDADWQILAELPKLQRSAAGSAAQGQREALAGAWGQKLEQARAFQSSHPDDPRHNAARKIEATALLKLQQMANRKPSPLEDAFIDACISDASLPATDRYDISALAKDVRADRSAIKDIDGARALRARHAGELAREFPDDPRGYGYLLAVAKSLPSGQAVTIANELLASGAPANIKEGADGLLAQKNMEGQILHINGLDLAAYNGRPVVIYTWSVQQPEIFEFVKRRCVVPGVKLIGVNIDTGADAAAARQLAQELKPPGDLYYDGGGMDGPIASQLRLQTAISVYIIDAEGRLVDTRGHENTTEKLKALLMPITNETSAIGRAVSPKPPPQPPDGALGEHALPSKALPANAPVAFITGIGALRGASQAASVEGGSL